MKATICDFCKQPVSLDDSGDPKVNTIEINRDPNKDGFGDGYSCLDICIDCFAGVVILSEQRRTRTRKPPVKRGRPRKTKAETVEVGDGSPNL